MRAKSELRAKEEETIALRKRNIELIGLVQVWSAPSACAAHGRARAGASVTARTAKERNKQINRFGKRRCDGSTDPIERGDATAEGSCARRGARACTPRQNRASVSHPRLWGPCRRWSRGGRRQRTRCCWRTGRSPTVPAVPIVPIVPIVPMVPIVPIVPIKPKCPIVAGRPHCTTLPPSARSPTLVGAGGRRCARTRTGSTCSRTSTRR
jgi:hypothetical protein